MNFLVDISCWMWPSLIWMEINWFQFCRFAVVNFKWSVVSLSHSWLFSTGWVTSVASFPCILENNKDKTLFFKINIYICSYSYFTYGISNQLWWSILPEAYLVKIVSWTCRLSSVAPWWKERSVENRLIVKENEQLSSVHNRALRVICPFSLDNKQVLTRQGI